MRSFVIWISLLFFLLFAHELVNGQLIPDSIMIKPDGLEPSEKIDKLVELTWANREKDPDMALGLAEKGVSLANRHNINKQLPQVYGYSGVICQHYKDQTEKAIPLSGTLLKYEK